MLSSTKSNSCWPIASFLRNSISSELRVSKPTGRAATAKIFTQSVIDAPIRHDGAGRDEDFRRNRMQHFRFFFCCFASFCVVKRLIRKRDFADPSFRQIVFVHVHRLRDTRYTCREFDLILKIKSSHSKAQHFQMTVYVSLYYHQSDFLCEFFSSSIFISWYSTINRSNFLLHATTRLSSKP